MCKEGVLKFKPGDLVVWPLPSLAGGPEWRGIVVKGPVQRWPAPVVVVQWLIDDAPKCSEHSTHVLKKLEVESV
jgi:hypothetical protein